MTALTTSYDATVGESRTSLLRRMLAGAAVFDGLGGVFCFAAATVVASWLSIPRGAVYATGALFLVAAAAGGRTLRRNPLNVAWIVAANELFAAWCLFMLVTDSPNALGAALLSIATASSAGTGVVEHLLATRRSSR
jgi:hypothetical protein